jgi:hypothetical protein
MTLAGDSILVTPGTGATVATHTVATKEHQVVMIAAESGHIIGSKDTFFFRVANQVHVAAASTIHFDIFNADATVLVRVVSIRQIPDIVTAVTGVATNWSFQRTTAAGTGGTALTAYLPDLSQSSLSASITARSKPTGGGTASTVLNTYAVHSEETNTGTMTIAAMGGLELIPETLRNLGGVSHGILLRQNQGLSVTQTTSSVAGNTGWLIGFTVE